MDFLSRARRFAAILVATSLMGLAPDAASPASPEYSVKAAYLSKFGIFVEWPKSAFETPQSPVVLCVLGADPFGEVLDNVVEGQRIGERPIVIRRVKDVGRNSGCNILYVGGSDEPPIARALGAVNGAGVLTVTDDGHSAQTTGIVDFILQDNRVRFAIDDRAAAQNGITISSHLLSLAVSVKPRS
jgi:hypothetical protein